MYKCPKCGSMKIRIERRIDGEIKCLDCNYIISAGKPHNGGKNMAIAKPLIDLTPQGFIAQNIAFIHPETPNEDGYWALHLANGTKISMFPDGTHSIDINQGR